MPKTVFQIIKFISILFSTLMTIWLIFLSMFLIGNGGKYSITTESGAMVCGIPFFTEENWLWTLFEFYGIPLIILIASWRTKNVCNEKLKSLISLQICD